MSKVSRYHTMEHVITTIHSVGKLTFFMGVFLFLGELLALIGATSRASQMVDGIAMVFTLCLLCLSLTGARIVSYFWKRACGQPEEHSAL